MANFAWGTSETEHFYQLNPDSILKAIDQMGIQTTGRVLQLNSMENRVYEIELEINESEIENESQRFVVAKFYRPGRWSKEQIQDEHDFLLELKEREIPAIAPLVFDGRTLFTMEDEKLHFCVFPKVGGRTPYEMSDEELEIFGRTIGRIHSTGKVRPANHRLTLNLESYCDRNLEAILSSNHLPGHYRSSYENSVKGIRQLMTPLFNDIDFKRIHGDLHLGNLMWRDGMGPLLVDFDDFLNGPAVQDFWLLTPGRDHETLRKRQMLLYGYQQVCDFNPMEWKLVECLRALRYIHFTAWIGLRYEDQSFKNAFPHYGTDAYWAEQVQDLREQHAHISEQMYL